jgi:hypothetical protein
MAWMRAREARNPLVEILLSIEEGKKQQASQRERGLFDPGYFVPRPLQIKPVERTQVDHRSR